MKNLNSKSQYWLTLALLSIGSHVLAAEPVKVLRDVPFSEDSRIAGKIKRECYTLGNKISDFLVQFSAEKGIEVLQVDELDINAPGYSLQLEITDAVSRGNAFIGHAKYMEAHGELFLAGESLGDMDYSRDSMGGFGAGFKGSCSVLGRNAKALGKDFSVWLSQQDAFR